MAYGVRTYTAAGVEQLGTSKSAINMLDSFLATSNGSKNFSVLAGRKLSAFVDGGVSSKGGANVNVSGSTVSWTLTGACTRAQVTVLVVL